MRKIIVGNQEDRSSAVEQIFSGYRIINFSIVPNFLPNRMDSLEQLKTDSNDLVYIDNFDEVVNSLDFSLINDMRAFIIERIKTEKPILLGITTLTGKAITTTLANYFSTTDIIACRELSSSETALLQSLNY